MWPMSLSRAICCTAKKKWSLPDAGYQGGKAYREHGEERGVACGPLRALIRPPTCSLTKSADTTTILTRRDTDGVFRIVDTKTSRTGTRYAFEFVANHAGAAADIAFRHGAAVRVFERRDANHVAPFFPS